MTTYFSVFKMAKGGKFGDSGDELEEKMPRGAPSLRTKGKTAYKTRVKLPFYEPSLADWQSDNVRCQLDPNDNGARLLDMNDGPHKFGNRIISRKELGKEVDSALDEWGKDGSCYFAKSMKNHTFFTTDKTGQSGIRIDLQNIDSESPDRPRTANIQLQINGVQRIKGSPTSLVEVHIELDKEFRTADVIKAIKLGIRERKVVWLFKKVAHTPTLTPAHTPARKTTVRKKKK